MSYLKLSLSSEIKITLGKSNCYLRVISVLYLFTAWVMIHSSWPLLLTILFLCAGIMQFYSDLIYRSACKTIKEIRSQNGKWLLVSPDQNEQLFDEAKILIYNPFFQLISFTTKTNKKLIVLFNDQVSPHELRLLHLKTCETGI